MNNPCLSTAPIVNLQRRASLAKQLRAFFDSRGFTEVQTPVLSRYCVIDRHLDPIRIPAPNVAIPSQTDSHYTPNNEPSSDPSTDQYWYLQTSPEQAMKRLLASGLGSCYQLGPVFRSAEFGPVHNPEFTMAEWYDLHASLDQGLQLLDELLQNLLHTQPALQIRFASAFEQTTGITLFDASTADLANWATNRKLVDSIHWSNDWDDWVNLIFSFVVQPTLGFHRPTLITHFPASQAALAKLDSTDPRTAERYEAFYQGVELANGYHELLNADDLEFRSKIANQQRIEDGKFPLPEKNPLLDAMRIGFPSCCGCALGFDRLVMLACNATNLSDVIPFPADRA
jgi:lysyl-tRNA synthetase class 2